MLALVADNKVVTGLAYAAFVLLKVLAVSHWNVATALAVLSLSPTAGLLLGAILSALPWLALSVTAFLLYLGLSGHWAGRWAKVEAKGLRGFGKWLSIRRWLALTMMLLLIPIVLLPPVQHVVLCLGPALFIGLVARATRNLRGRQTPSVSISHAPTKEFGREMVGRHWQMLAEDRPTFFGALILAGLLLALSYTPVLSSVWLPHERVSVHDGGTMVGYVLHASDGGLTMLMSGSRALAYVSIDDVTARAICGVSDKWPLTSNRYHPVTIAQLLGLEGSLEACSETKLAD